MLPYKAKLTVEDVALVPDREEDEEGKEVEEGEEDEEEA